MAGKKVWIHSLQSAEPPVIGFVQLWSPIIKGVGAEVILDSQVAQDQLELLEWLKNGRVRASCACIRICDSGGVDILLTDPSCEPFVAEAVEGSENGVVVGSEWVIEVGSTSAQCLRSHPLISGPDHWRVPGHQPRPLQAQRLSHRGDFVSGRRFVPRHQSLLH